MAQDKAALMQELEDLVCALDLMEADFKGDGVIDDLEKSILENIRGQIVENRRLIESAILPLSSIL